MHTPPPEQPEQSQQRQAVAVNLAIGIQDARQLLTNVIHFARLLRRVGFRNSGGERCALAAQVLEKTALVSRADTYWALAAVFVSDAAELPLFEQAFALFWRSDRAVLAAREAEQQAAGGQTLRRLAEQLTSARRQVPLHEEVDAADSAGDEERLEQKDFEQMDGAEWRAAMRCVRDLPAALKPLRTRRRKPATVGGRSDLRRSLRAARACGGELMDLKTSRPRTRPPTIVILADISASMTVYARMLVHLIAALSGAQQQRVHAFLFGTRLTPLRRMKSRDADACVVHIAAATRDWHGGTRIGEALTAFNRDWSRRVLAGGAVVLLATDGLERGDLPLLESALTRLRRSCRRLIWLNPLLRYDAYQPLAGGARLLTRTATSQFSIHSVRSLADLLTHIGGGEAGLYRSNGAGG